jgi:hypothetical protein
MKVANRSFENATEFKYFGVTVTYQYCIYEEIKSRLNLGNIWYRVVQNPLCSCLLCTEI